MARPQECWSVTFGGGRKLVERAVMALPSHGGVRLTCQQ